MQLLQEQRFSFYNHCAIIIQRMFRGYFCRAYIYNMKKRKQELQFVEQKNAEMIQYVEQKRQEMAMQVEQDKQEAAFREFEQVASTMHHLIGTKCVPSVLHQHGETIFAHVPHVEDYLKSNAKRLPAVAAATRTASDITGRFESSVQNSSHYHTQQVLERTERFLEKKTRKQQQPLRHHLAHTIPHQPLLNTQLPYCTPQLQVTRPKMEPISTLPFLPVGKASKLIVFDRHTVPVPCALPAIK